MDYSCNPAILLNAISTPKQYRFLLKIILILFKYGIVSAIYSNAKEYTWHRHGIGGKEIKKGITPFGLCPYCFFLIMSKIFLFFLQFEIVGYMASHGKIPKGIPNEAPYLNGKWLYNRILIKRVSE